MEGANQLEGGRGEEKQLVETSSTNTNTSTFCRSGCGSSSGSRSSRSRKEGLFQEVEGTTVEQISESKQL